MKHINLIQLATGIILVLFGMLFGVRLLSEANGSGNFNLAWIMYPGQSSSAATYSPLYAGICIISGVYLLGKLKYERNV